MSERDRTSKTLTAGQLIDRLSRVDPNLPVVFEARDEPLGDYGVRSVEVVDMQRERTYADGMCGTDVFHGPESRYPEPKWHTSKVFEYDPPGPVVLLGMERPWQPVIDAEVEQRALPGGAR